MAEKKHSYQSSSIFYRTIGNGRPVVLLHGFGEDGDIWQNQVEFLSAGSGGKDKFFLIIPDLPGSGRSEMIPDMSMEGMAELVKELIEQEAPKFLRQPTEAEGVCLLGHSMGGYITLAFAEKYPDQLSAFGLIHSSAFADNEEKKANRTKSIGFIKKYGAYEFLKSSIPELFFPGHDGSKPSDLYIENLVEKSRSFADEAIIQYYQAMINRPDRTAVLKTFSKPVLFIIGEHDKAVPFEQSMQQCYLPGQSHIHILRNSAHMGMLEEPAKINDAIQRFLNAF